MFEHFEHKADIGIRGYGSTMGKAFEEAAKALTDIIVDAKEIKPQVKREVWASSGDYEALLVAFLNELLFLKDKEGILGSKFCVKIIERQGKHFLNANITGSKINAKKNAIKVDAKAATYSQLSVRKEGTKWVAQCIIDV